MPLNKGKQTSQIRGLYCLHIWVNRLNIFYEVCFASKMTHTDLRSVLYTNRREVCFVAKLGSTDIKSVLLLNLGQQTSSLFCLSNGHTNVKSVLHLNRGKQCTLLTANSLHDITWNSGEVNIRQKGYRLHCCCKPFQKKV